MSGGGGGGGGGGGCPGISRGFVLIGVAVADIDGTGSAEPEIENPGNDSANGVAKVPARKWTDFPAQGYFQDYRFWEEGVHKF